MAKKYMYEKIDKPCVKCGSIMKKVTKRRITCKKCHRVHERERNKIKYHNDPEYRRAVLRKTSVNRAVKTIVTRELLFEGYLEILRT
jgi:hypothetical protein